MASHKEYRGVLKARIAKIYGGDVTIDKCKKLKARKGATPRAVSYTHLRAHET